MSPNSWNLGKEPFHCRVLCPWLLLGWTGRGSSLRPFRERAAATPHQPTAAGARGVHPRGAVSLLPAALTDGFTVLVSINEGHGGAQGHVWVTSDSLQAADGILDALCKESPCGYAPGLQAFTGLSLYRAEPRLGPMQKVPSGPFS